MSRGAHEFACALLFATSAVLWVCGVCVGALVCFRNALVASSDIPLVVVWIGLSELILPPILFTAIMPIRIHQSKNRWKTRYRMAVPDCLRRSRVIRFAITVLALQLTGIVTVMLAFAAPGMPFSAQIYMLSFAGISVGVAGVVSQGLSSRDIELARRIESLAAEGRRPCTSCGYDCSFIESTRCPECGGAVELLAA